MRIRWRNLELPNRVSVERETFNGTFGKFIVEPFERGFGHTIGNGLRRVLLSSLEGTAAVWMKIPGVSHEFMAIEDVVEDVTEIVLSVKKLQVSYEGEGPIRLTLSHKKKGPVTAALFSTENDAEIVNPDLHICTLSADREFSMELEVRRGRGYLTAEENETGSVRGGAKNTRKEIDQEIGKIWLDAAFSPVRRVRYYTEDTRVGKLTDYDRLYIEIWTDGTVRPDHALVEASKIYRKHLNPFVNYQDAGGEMPRAESITHVAAGPGGDDLDLDEKLTMPIESLSLSMRSSNCLESEQIKTVGELAQRTEADLLNVRNFGKTSLKEIVSKLEELGLTLGMKIKQPS